MLQYTLLSIICVGMMIFALGAVLLSSEEKPYRYKLDITDEHEI